RGAGEIMSFVYPKAGDLAGDPIVGKGECVDLIKQFVPGLIGVTTQAWREGANVMASPQLQRGTAIATFFDGKFPHKDTGQHAAMFLAHSGAGFWVIEQHKKSKTIIRRRIEIPRNGQRQADRSFPNASNNALAFSVIER
ncbi:MAG TPA: BPSL0067 family protein, partial [Telluria sp.]|nr:BPSL0067 family protein [Telluria sp.]